MVKCYHLSDGTMILGTPVGGDTEVITIRDVFVMSKVRQTTSASLTGAEVPVKVVLTKYDSFNHTPGSVVDFRKSGIIASYDSDDAVDELYDEFVATQTEQMNRDDETPHESFTDMISRVLTEDSPDINELRKTTRRAKKED